MINRTPRKQLLRIYDKLYQGRDTGVSNGYLPEYPSLKPHFTVMTEEKEDNSGYIISHGHIHKIEHNKNKKGSD